MAKSDISRNGKLSRKYRGKSSFNATIDEILRDQKFSKAAKEPKQFNEGPRMYLKRLIESGYPKEEAIKALVKKFERLKDENDIIENWIKDINQKIESKRDSKEVSDER